MHLSSYPVLSLIFPIACIATLYDAFEDITASTFDFVIVGGLFSFITLSMMSGTESFLQRGLPVASLQTDSLKILVHRFFFSRPGPRRSFLILRKLNMLKPRLARNIGVIASIIPMFPAQLNPDTPFDWNYTTTPQPGFNGRSINYRSLFLLSHTSVDCLNSTGTHVGRFHLRQ